MKKVLLAIPAFNEEKNIGLVLNDLLASDKEFDILVINDGSKDRTESIVRKMGVDIVNLPFNLGYGSALQTGYKYAVLKNYDYLITYDADYQHRAEDLNTVYDMLIEDKYDIILGSRFLNKDIKPDFLKRIAYLLFKNLVFILTKKKITDPTSGFQGLNRKAFSFYSKMDNYSPDFPDADILIMVLWAGYRIKEVPIGVRKRPTGTSMHNGIKPLIYFVKVFLSILIIIFRNRIMGRRKK